MTDETNNEALVDDDMQRSLNELAALDGADPTNSSTNATESATAGTSASNADTADGNANDSAADSTDDNSDSTDGADADDDDDSDDPDLDAKAAFVGAALAAVGEHLRRKRRQNRAHSGDESDDDDADEAPRRAKIARISDDGDEIAVNSDGMPEIHIHIADDSAGDIIGIVMTKGDEEEPTAADLYNVGTVARIIKKINLPDGGVNIFISTIKRFKIRKVLRSASPIAVAVEYLDDVEDDTFEVKALTRALISEMKEVSENNPLFSEEMRLNMVNIDHPGKIADFIASILNVEKEDQQKVLEQLNVRARMEQVLVFIKKEQELLRIQKKVQHELNERVEKNQRDYFLREEMKAIQEELGTEAGGGSDYQKLKAKIEALGFTGEIKEATESELDKFHLMDTQSPEYIMARNYLELICDLPWKDAAVEQYDLARAYKVLEGDHYGLDDVKKRIMEYLAVRKLAPSSFWWDRPAWARPAWGIRLQTRWESRSTALAWAVCATKPKLKDTAAPTSAPCREKSCKGLKSPKQKAPSL